MKKIILSAFAVINLLAMSQTIPLGTAPSANVPTSLPAVRDQTERAWYRGGNNPGGAALTNNIFGTFWDSPIYTYTNSLGRSRLNGELTNTVGSYNTMKDGYMWLGYSETFANSWYTGTGPFSLLHLNGRDGDFVQENGHRNWMRTGITFTDNNDKSYIGLRQVGSGTNYDITETVIGWSDNSGSAYPGPDDVAFRFTGDGQQNLTNFYNDLRSPHDNDGLHVARFCSNGLIGFGDVFGSENISPSGYIRPQSLLHLSYDHQNGSSNEAYGFMQLTYRYNGLGGGEKEQDGLRLGIDNDQYRTTTGLHGFLRWQEKTAFIVQSDWNDVDNDNSIESSERMRISSDSAPLVENAIYDPSNLNVTRVSINYDGATPIDKPKALVHLGSNISTFPIEYDANFMDYGTLVANGTRTLFTGITPSGYSDPNQNVIGFGGFPTSGDLVFIEANDKEVARFDKENNNMGIGDFSPTGVYAADPLNNIPTHRIDVEGNGRFRKVPDNTRHDYLMLGQYPDVNNDGTTDQTSNDDVELRKLAFPNDPNVYLDGTGNWTSAGDGLNCWDLNGDGIKDANEDINGDQLWNHLDCQGPQGIPGTNGVVGTNGLNMLTINSPLTPGNGGCINGGVFLQFGLDANNDGILNAAEINPALNQTICNGLNGAPGPMGPQGPAGSVVTADNGLTMSTPTNVQLGGTLLHNTTVDQDNYNMLYSNAGMFGVGSFGTNAKLSVKNIGNPNPYASIFQLIDENNLIRLNVDRHGVTTYKASRVGGTNPIMFDHITYVDDVTPDAANLTGIGNFIWPSVGIGGCTFNAYYSSVFNRLGKTIGYSTIQRWDGNNGQVATADNVGFSADLRDATRNFGTWFNIGDYASGNDNRGIYARVFGQGDVYGAKYEAYSRTTAYGIRASAGIDAGFTGTAWAGYFDGNVHVNGDITATGTITPSDQQFKANINNITTALDKISALQPRTYHYDTINFPDFNFEGDQQMGLIAQEVEQVLPTIVTNLKRPAERDSAGNIIRPELAYKGVEYTELIPLLVAGMKEQQTQIASKDSVINNLNDRLTQLENCLSALLPTLCSMNQEAIQRNNDEQQKQYEKALDKSGNTQTENSELRSALEVRLSDKNAIILSQNVPNPFAEMTTIKYNIPATVKEAQIHFYTNKGIIINSVDIVERGNGEIRVFAEDLSSGLYTYSLVADGKVVATKKMLKN